jgi:hypothetical protein
LFPDHAGFSAPSTVPVDLLPPASDVSGGNAHPGEGSPGHAAKASAHPPAPGLNPELVRRFHALVEEVTDELMVAPQQDRNICRADAIALLIATCEQAESPSDGGESPLQYLLLEEQRKAVAALGEARFAADMSTFLRA